MSVVKRWENWKWFTGISLPNFVGKAAMLHHGILVHHEWCFVECVLVDEWDADEERGVVENWLGIHTHDRFNLFSWKSGWGWGHGRSRESLVKLFLQWLPSANAVSEFENCFVLLLSLEDHVEKGKKGKDAYWVFLLLLVSPWYLAALSSNVPMTMNLGFFGEKIATEWSLRTRKLHDLSSVTIS